MREGYARMLWKVETCDEKGDELLVDLGPGGTSPPTYLEYKDTVWKFTKFIDGGYGPDHDKAKYRKLKESEWR